LVQDGDDGSKAEVVAMSVVNYGGIGIRTQKKPGAWRADLYSRSLISVT
jgi:hypothetical protein